MTTKNMARAGVAAAAALAALAATDLGASAQTVYQPYRPYPAYANGVSPRAQRIQYGDQDRPLTVNRRRDAQGYAVAPVRRYDPYTGPATIVTAPIDVAGRLVALPFQVLGSIFPARGNTPLVVVGAPVYAAGQIAQLPFNLMQAPFGRPAPYLD